MPAASAPSKLATFYKDFNIGMKPHPVTGALLTVKNAASVKQGVRNLILTNHHERPYRPDYGGNVGQYLFELFDTSTVADIRSDIQYAFESYMRRAELISTDVSASEDNNQLTITITFLPINQVELETIEITVERVR